MAEESIKVIRFTGEKDDWVFWESEFLSHARRKEFHEVLAKDLVPPDAKCTLAIAREKASQDEYQTQSGA